MCPSSISDNAFTKYTPTTLIGNDKVVPLRSVTSMTQTSDGFYVIIWLSVRVSALICFDVIFYWLFISPFSILHHPIVNIILKFLHAHVTIH